MALSFSLTFAGVPFLADVAHQLRIEPDAPDAAPLEFWRPNPDVVDEVDRLIAFRFLHDISATATPGAHTLDALPLPVRDDYNPHIEAVRIGDWYYPNTMSRFSVFRGLATSKMVKAMLAATKGAAGTFTMQAVPQGQPNGTTAGYTVSTPMFMLPARPLAQHGAGMDGLFLVTLVDDRFYARGTPITFHPTPSSTWASLLSQTAAALGITLTVPAIESVYGQPEPDSQLWLNLEDSGQLLDALAFNVGRIVVRNFDGTYKLMRASESLTQVNTNYGNAKKVVLVAGGDILCSGSTLPAGDLRPGLNTVCPATINVTFPKFVTADPVPHFLNPRVSGVCSAWYEDSYGDVHLVPVPITSGGSLVSGITGTSQETIHTTAKALYSGEVYAASGMVPLNASAVTALAMQLAQDRYAWLASVNLDAVLPGTVPWVPEGIHDIVWHYSCRDRLATTRVMRSEWNFTPSDTQHSFSGNVGCGGKTVAQTWRDQSGGAYYRVNLVTAGSGIQIVPGRNTSGGINEVILMAASGAAGGTSLAAFDTGTYSGNIPTIGGITFDDTTGVRMLSGTISGRAYIDLLPATPIQQGAVTCSNQTLGNKDKAIVGRFGVGLSGTTAIPTGATCYITPASGASSGAPTVGGLTNTPALLANGALWIGYSDTTPPAVFPGCEIGSGYSNQFNLNTCFNATDSANVVQIRTYGGTKAGISSGAGTGLLTIDVGNTGANTAIDANGTLTVWPNQTTTNTIQLVDPLNNRVSLTTRTFGGRTCPAIDFNASLVSGERTGDCYVGSLPVTSGAWPNGSLQTTAVFIIGPANTTPSADGKPSYGIQSYGDSPQIGQWGQDPAGNTFAGGICTSIGTVIGSGRVASGSFAPGAITSGAIASGAIPQYGLGSGVVLNINIGSGAITSGAVGSGAIVSGNIGSGQVGTPSMASGTTVSFARGLSLLSSGVF